MKLHKEFGVNALNVVCPCCGKTMYYRVYGDVVKENANISYIFGDGVCESCKDKLDKETVFLAVDTLEDGRISHVYEVIWIKNEGLLKLFKDLSEVNIINILSKEDFYSIFGNIIANREKDKLENS